VLTDGADEAAVRALLTAAGIADARISPIVPGLEDVFVNLVTRPAAAVAAP
jgi:hypothetical protein